MDIALLLAMALTYDPMFLYCSHMFNVPLQNPQLTRLQSASALLLHMNEVNETNGLNKTGDNTMREDRFMLTFTLVVSMITFLISVLGFALSVAVGCQPLAVAFFCGAIAGSIGLITIGDQFFDSFPTVHGTVRDINEYRIGTTTVYTTNDKPMASETNEVKPNMTENKRNNMTVRELITSLQALNQDMDICLLSPDEGDTFPIENHFVIRNGQYEISAKCTIWQDDITCCADCQRNILHAHIDDREVR